MLKRTEVWNNDEVRSFCICHNYYTRGDCEAYNKMLHYVATHKPTTEAIEWVAKNILEHSNDPENTVSNIAYQLFKEAVTVFFDEED